MGLRPNATDSKADDSNSSYESRFLMVQQFQSELRSRLDSCGRGWQPWLIGCLAQSLVAFKSLWVRITTSHPPPATDTCKPQLVLCMFWSDHTPDSLKQIPSTLFHPMSITKFSCQSLNRGFSQRPSSAAHTWVVSVRHPCQCCLSFRSCRSCRSSCWLHRPSDGSLCRNRSQVAAGLASQP